MELPDDSQIFDLLPKPQFLQKITSTDADAARGQAWRPLTWSRLLDGRIRFAHYCSSEVNSATRKVHYELLFFNL